MAKEAITVNGMSLSEWLNPRTEQIARDEIKLFVPPSLPALIDEIAAASFDPIETYDELETRFHSTELSRRLHYNQGNIGYMIEAQVNLGIDRFMQKNPATIRKPVTTLVDSRHYRFQPDGGSSVVVRERNRAGRVRDDAKSTHCEYDSLLMVDGTPVIIESKYITGKKQLSKLRGTVAPERVATIARPLRDLYRTDTIGYAVIFSGKDSQEETDVVSEFRDRQGVYQEFAMPQEKIQERWRAIIEPGVIFSSPK